MVSVSLAELVWLLTVTLAVLVSSSPAGALIASVALMVKVTLLLLGRDGIVRPAPCIAPTVGLAGQVAPPPAVQLTLLAVR